MSSLRYVLLLAITLLCIGCSTNINVKSPTYAEKLQLETVALVKEVHGELLAYCTGVWVAENVVLTASHCTKNEKSDDNTPKKSQVGNSIKYLVYSDVGQSFDVSSTFTNAKSAIVIAHDDDIDLALLLAANAPSHPTAALPNTNSKTGDQIAIVGHTSGYWWTYSPGTLAMIRYMDGPHPIKQLTLQVSAPVWFGNSGGGAFNADGKLIGIASYIDNDGPFLAFFIHTDTIRFFLKKNKIIGNVPSK